MDTDLLSTIVTIVGLVGVGIGVVVLLASMYPPAHVPDACWTRLTRKTRSRVYRNGGEIDAAHVDHVDHVDHADIGGADG